MGLHREPMLALKLVGRHIFLSNCSPPTWTSSPNPVHFAPRPSLVKSPAPSLHTASSIASITEVPHPVSRPRQVSHTHTTQPPGLDQEANTHQYMSLCLLDFTPSTLYPIFWPNLTHITCALSHLIVTISDKHYERIKQYTPPSPQKSTKHIKMLSCDNYIDEPRTQD